MLQDLIGALTFLTTLPVSWIAPPRSTAPGRIFGWFPIVGLLVGAILGAVASIRFLPADLVAFLVLAAWVILTGGLHLDGFADCCDGLLATVSLDRRLEIMKDPRTGSFAVAGLVLLLLGKWTALRTLSPGLLILPPVLGRWSMVLAAAGFPQARSSGLAAYFRDGLGRIQIIAASAAAVIIALLLGWRGVLALVVTALVVMVVGRWAASRLGGGLSGDVYGALCELVELICLILLNAS